MEKWRRSGGEEEEERGNGGEGKVEVEEKVRRRSGRGGGANKIQISALEFCGACAVGAPQNFFFEFFIFAGKNLDFAVTFYSFRIFRFCKFQNRPWLSNLDVEFSPGHFDILCVFFEFVCNQKSSLMILQRNFAKKVEIHVC